MAQSSSWLAISVLLGISGLLPPSRASISTDKAISWDLTYLIMSKMVRVITGFRGFHPCNWWLVVLHSQ